MTTQWLIPPDCYLIDSGSIIAFSGLDRANPNKYLAYRDRIWAHLEEMIPTGRLKTVKEVWPELKRLDPKSYDRLHPFHDQLTMPRPRDTYIEAIKLVSKYGDTIVDPDLHYTMLPPDPFLIVCARKEGLVIITEEKSQAERTARWHKNKLHIPDICDKEKMRPCIHLEQFLKAEGVIPNGALLT